MTASEVDYYGRKKKGYFALQQPFNPIHAMMDWPGPAEEPAGSTLRRAVYVVNDYATAYPSLTVTWKVVGVGDEELVCGTIPCTAAPNSLQRTGEVSWDIPAASGSYRFLLAFKRDAEVLSSNDYIVQVHAVPIAAGSAAENDVDPAHDDR